MADVALHEHALDSGSTVPRGEFPTSLRICINKRRQHTLWQYESKRNGLRRMVSPQRSEAAVHDKDPKENVDRLEWWARRRLERRCEPRDDLSVEARHKTNHSGERAER